MGIVYGKGTIAITPSDTSGTFPATNLAWRVVDFINDSPASLINLSLQFVSAGVYNIAASSGKSLGTTIGTWKLNYYSYPIGTVAPGSPTVTQALLALDGAGNFTTEIPSVPAGQIYLVWLTFTDTAPTTTTYPIAKITTVWD